MPSWKKKFFSFYRIFTKIIAVFFIIILISHLWKVSAQVVHYQEYIRGEKNIGDRKRIEEGAQNRVEIEKIEKAILSEVEVRLQKKGQTYSEKEELRQAKEKLEEAEKQAKDSKEKYEKANEEYQKTKEDSSSTEKQRDETGIIWQINQDNEEVRKKELENVRQKVIENIQSELKRANLAITELDIEFVVEGKKWEKRLWYNSLRFDMTRFFLIQPCQAISRWCGIMDLAYGAFWDLLLKVLLMRLLLNWISYPPNLDFDFAKSQEKTEPVDLASLEEERERAMQQLKFAKQLMFNLGMSFLLINLFSWHPFAFDRSNNLFSQYQTSFLWIILYLVISVASNFSFYKFYSKKNIALKDYLRKNWFMSVVFLAFSLVYLQPNRFADFLCVLLSEVINILINLVKIVYRRNKPRKKEKIKWEQKEVWSSQNYKN